MKLIIDSDTRMLTIADAGAEHTCPLFGHEAFERLTREWVRVGWALKYSYQFTWLGRPIIQLPEDMVRTQEAIFRIQPDVIVETGVAHGGSLIFYASLCQLLGRGRVIGIDLTIRPENRKAIENHALAHRITLVEGDSIAPDVVRRVHDMIRPDETVMVLLDSNHSRAHVLRELEAYGPLVTPESYLVATDGIMHDLHDVPHGRPEWTWDNPADAAREFARGHPEFLLETPAAAFTESTLQVPVTHWPSGWLRRVTQATVAA